MSAAENVDLLEEFGWDIGLPSIMKPKIKDTKKQERFERKLAARMESEKIVIGPVMRRLLDRRDPMSRTEMRRMIRAICERLETETAVGVSGMIRRMEAKGLIVQVAPNLFVVGDSIESESFFGSDR